MDKSRLSGQPSWQEQWLSMFQVTNNIIYAACTQMVMCREGVGFKFGPHCVILKRYFLLLIFKALDIIIEIGKCLV